MVAIVALMMTHPGELVPTAYASPSNFATPDDIQADGSRQFETFEALMDQFEFEWEAHSVTTDDGYILNMFRLVGPKPGAQLFDDRRHQFVKQPDEETFYPERIQKIEDEKRAREEEQRAREEEEKRRAIELEEELQRRDEELEQLKQQMA